MRDIDAIDDFTADGVRFDHTGDRSQWKVWWPDRVGAGLMAHTEADTWEGYDEHYDRRFLGVATKAEAVRKLVAREWDPVDVDLPVPIP